MVRGFRQLVPRSSWIAIFVLLTASAAFTQQQDGQNVPGSETTLKANDRIAQLAAASQGIPGEYVIGTGDLLVVEVFDVPELSRELRVSETGFISLPLLSSKVRAGGLTTSQLQEKLAELLQAAGLVSTPQVNISVKEQRSSPITIIGAVRTPTVYQAMRQTTLIEVLSHAGGIAPDAGSVVIVTRPPVVPLVVPSDAAADQSQSSPAESQTFTISLENLLDTGDATFNIPVFGGDVVSVPRAGIIYAVGALSKPGGFVMSGENGQRMTALKILSLAGGTLNSAKISQTVILRKNQDTGETQELPVDLDKVLHLKAEDVTLQANDILFVPDSAGKRALRRIGDVALSLTTGVTIMRAGRY